MEKSKNILYLLYFVYKKFKKEKHFKKIVIADLFLEPLGTVYPLVWSFALAQLLDTILKTAGINGNMKDLVPSLLLFIVINILGILISQGQAFIESKRYLYEGYWKDEVYVGNKAALEPKVFEDSEFMGKYNTLEWNDGKVLFTFQNAISIFAEVIAVVISFFALLKYSWILALLAIVSAIPSAIVVQIFGQKVWNIWGDVGEEKIKYSGYRWPFFSTDPEMMQEIFVFKYGRYLIDRMKEINYTFIKKLAITDNKRFLWSTIAALLTLVFFVLSLIFSVKLAITGVLSLGILTFVISAYQQFQNNISGIFNKVSTVLGNKKILSIFYEIQNHKSTIVNGNEKMILDESGIEIEFKDVWFKYPNTNKWVLKGINLSINNDEDLAVVGRNGAGKTTLVKLILRIYDPVKGEILVNGRNLKNLDIMDYYRYVGVLTQHFNRLDIVAEDNIYIGNTEIKDEALMKKAAKMADIDDTLSKLPLGYKTFLNRELKNGAALSGGQWQKLAIARAFYRNAKLLVLDEPTSAVDALSEEKIFDNIRENAKNKTTLIISHRFATVRKAKRIIVIDRGEVVEDGNHESLICNNGLYFQMYNTQVNKE